MNSREIIVLGVLVLNGMMPAALPQVSSGTILGTVTDRTGARLPGAEVIVTDEGTGQERRSVTSGEGDYVVPNLLPGRYSLVVALPGFKSQSVQGIVLRVDQRARVDVSLELGEISDQVTVQGAAPVIETDNASIGAVIDNKKVLELPLNGRQFLQLALLTPGTIKNHVIPGLYDESGGAFSANGFDPAGNTTMLDGIINMEFGAGRQNFSPSIDMIEEFKIHTNIYDAAFGLSGAAQINVVSKRGTKEYHGSAYLFHRNDNLDARNFFQRGAIPEFRRHQFGGTFGGPIPGSSKDFFFFAYEGKRQARGLTSTMNLPTAGLRDGDFSSVSTVIYDPLTLDAATGQRQPFPGNKIPADRITRQAKFIRQFWPQPTLPGLTRNFIANPTRVADGNQYSIRYDRNFSEKNALNFRFTRVLDTALEPQWRAFVPPLPGFGQNLDLRGHSLNSTWTHVLDSSTVNSFSFGFSRYWRNADNESTVAGFFLQGGSRGPVSGPEFFAGADIQGLTPDRQKAGFPRIAISGWSDPVADDTFAPVSEKYNNFVFSDTFSKVMGDHSWKVGFDIIRNTIPVEFEANTRGTISFTPRYSTASAGAPGDQFNALADFLLGQVTSSSFNGNRLSEDLVQSWYMLFVHDDWKVRPNLTLNLGLRYEIWDRMTEKLDRLVAYDLDTRNWVFAGAVPTLPGTPSPAVTAESVGLPRNMATKTEYNDFGPRIGFAWRLSDSSRTVLRGGYGLFYNWVTQNTTQAMAFGPPWVPSISITGNPDVPAVTFQVPYSSRIVPSVSGRVATARTNRTPYVQQYSLGVGHSLNSQLGLEVAYVGNAARKSFMNFNLNQPFPGPGPVAARLPFPGFGGLTGTVTWGTSHYDSLQVKVRKEAGAEGLMLLGSFTWAKALGTAVAGPNFLAGSQPIRDTRNWKAEAGPTAFDVRNIGSLSWVYELPVGRGKSLAAGLGGAAQAVIGGWKFGGIASFQGGRHLTPSDIFNVSNAGGSRPNVNGDPNGLNHSTRDSMINRYFDTSVFSRAASFTFGNAGTGIIQGPGLQIWDLSLYKDFQIRETGRLQFRVEFFNAFNHVNLGDPGTGFGSSSFGVISGAGDARSIQFGLRVDF